MFACEEDITLLGIKSGQDKFKVYYTEIPVKTSVLWMDSLRTTNLNGETSRLLAGRYVDPVFGTTEAQALFQYHPSSINTVVANSAVCDSIVLYLRFDFYTYGTSGNTTQTFNIHEIAQELDNGNSYFFNSDIDLSPTSIGSGTAIINEAFFKKEFEDTDKDSIMFIKVKLNNSFGQRLLDAVDPEDVNFTDPDEFKGIFKGLAIVPQQSDKVFGLDPNPLDRAFSNLTLYYREGAESKTMTFNFSKGVTFSKIIANRAGTELAGVNKYHTDFDPGFKRYIQGGTSIITKLDFSRFYAYTDTIPHMIINSAEIEISDIETSTNFKIPKRLSLSMLRSNNRYRYTSQVNKQDSLSFIAFGESLAIGDQSQLFVSQGQGQILSLEHSTTANTFKGLPTLFVQKLFDQKKNKYLFWALNSINPQPGKSVDRVVFPGDKVKLKIYYTRVILNNQ